MIGNQSKRFSDVASYAMKRIFFLLALLTDAGLFRAIADLMKHYDNNPFAQNASYGELRCPICWRCFHGWNRALQVVRHYVQDCRGDLLSEDVRSYVYYVLSRIELRLNQRALLRYARDAGFFAVGSMPDAISCHSLKRLGLLTLSGHLGAPLIERYWHITLLGELVLAAIEDREQEIDDRERTAGRERLPRQSHRGARA